MARLACDALSQRQEVGRATSRPAREWAFRSLMEMSSPPSPRWSGRCGAPPSPAAQGAGMHPKQVSGPLEIAPGLLEDRVDVLFLQGP